MPFDGAGGRQAGLVRGEEVLDRLRRTYELRQVVHDRRAVDDLYQVPGFAGRIGIISGHSRTFCAACSRLRVSARGQLRTCLYGPPVLDLRSDLRRRRSEEVIRDRIRDAVEQRFADGLAAQEAQGHDCYGGMFRIGG
jgi:cyclic pyranopterin phosphate synthase